MAAILDALALAVCVAVIPLGTVVVEVEPLVGWVVVVRMEPREGERVAAMNQVIDAKSPVVDAALGERGSPLSQLEFVSGCACGRDSEQMARDCYAGATYV